MKKINRISFLTVLMIIYNGSIILFSLSFKNIIDCLSKSNFSEYNKNIFTMLCLLILQMVSYNFYYRTKNNYIKDSIIELKTKLYNKIFSFPISYFREDSITNYISFIFNDLNRYEENYIYIKVDIAEKIILFIMGIIGVITIYPIFLIVVFVVLVISIFLPIIFQSHMKKYSKLISDSHGKCMNKFYEMFNGFTIIKFFQYDKKAIDECTYVTNNLENEKYKMKNYMITAQCSILFLSNILIVIVFILGGRVVSNGIMSVGMIISLIQLLFNITSPIITIVSSMNKLKSVINIKAKCDEILKWDVDSNVQLLDKYSFNESINLRDVSLQYDNAEVYALKNFNFKFEKNKKYAIVGANGSGKSTILKLLSTINEKYSGNIEYDGINSKKINRTFIYKNISYISQEIFLFNKSITENISMNKKYDRDKFYYLSSLLTLQNLIKQNDDCLNNISKNKKDFSGGEKQKIVIARELLKNTSILLADELDSSVDIKTSSKILEEIIKMKNLTVIMVTHNINDKLKDFDDILVMKEGELIEFGTYEELIEKKGYFLNKFILSDRQINYNLK